MKCKGSGIFTNVNVYLHIANCNVMVQTLLIIAHCCQGDWVEALIIFHDPLSLPVTMLGNKCPYLYPLSISIFVRTEEE